MFSKSREELIDSLVKIPPDEQNISKKSQKRRLQLALKIFEHIRAKNQEYFENKNNFTEIDDRVSFSQFEKPAKPVQENHEVLTKKSEFDHLELFRPYLNIIENYKNEHIQGDSEINWREKPKISEDYQEVKITKNDKLQLEDDIGQTENKSLRKVSQNEYKNWLKQIVWTAEDTIKIDLRTDPHTIKAAWYPALNQRTIAQYLAVNDNEKLEKSSYLATIYRGFSDNIKMLHQSGGAYLNIDPKNWFSLFPANFPHQDYTKGTLISFDDILNANNEINIDNISAYDFLVDKEIEKNERIPIRTAVGKSKLYSFDEKNRLVYNLPAKTFFISSDEYYWPPKRSEIVEDEVLRIQIKHSLPALDLQRTFFPTYMDILHLRRWHRPLLSDFHHGNKMKIGTHTVQNLKKYNEESLKIYQEIIEATKSEDVFLMKSLKDISSLNGHLILFEYSEEYPIFLNQIGMNSLIRMYYTKAGNSDKPPVNNTSYGDLAEIPANMSPFLGSISPDQPIMALENNMFRAPLYPHQPKITDFLMIRNAHGYFIRQIPAIFIVGQEHPKMEIPSPNSKSALNCSRERCQLYIFTLFMKCKETPKKIKIASVRKAFKQHSENGIRKRLKMCSDYIRIKTPNGKSNWWVLKNDFRLPTFEDLHEKLQPETMCGYYSMLAAQRRLKDAGYGKKSLFMAEDENDDDAENNKNIEEEILCAPWHTSRAFIMAQKGKCLMAVNGFADPTGCGEGFSFVRMNYKNPREEGFRSHQKSQLALDTDIRKLKLNSCRQILFEVGIPAERMDRMSRWDMINLIRNVATSSKSPHILDLIAKHLKGSRSAVIETTEKYKETCQAIFDRQNQILSSTQDFSSDEDDDISDIEELNKDLESMLQNKNEKNESKFIADDEEFSRLDLFKLLNDDQPLYDLEDENALDGTQNPMPDTSKIARLLINRTFIEDEKEFIRTEVVTDPRIIYAYLKITRNKNYRQVYAKHDVKTIEDLRREKKRVQDQLRRIKRIDEKESTQPKVEPEPPKEKIKTHVKCTACQAIGHMRTNRICPRYAESHQQNVEKSSESSESEEEKPIEQENEINQNSIKVEGTKLVLNKGLVDAADEEAKKSLTLKIPKDLLKRKKQLEDYNYYGNKQLKNPSSRRKSDPKIFINAIFEEIINNLKNSSESWPFQQPVCPKKVPDYYVIIKKPMTLLSLKDGAKALQYDHRDQFIEDLKLIEYNSTLYNGLTHPITTAAKAIVEMGINEIARRSNEISLIEVEINPLLSNDSQQKLSWIFESIINSARALPAAHPFLYPVNTKQVRDYHLYIQKPMDLETVKMNIFNNSYLTREAFLIDVELILSNCIQYNGVNHAYTKMAHEIHDHIVTRLQKVWIKLY